MRKVQNVPLSQFSRIKLEIARFIFRKRVRDLDFTIISSNCLGSRIYKDLHVPYNTPFVGLFLYAPCYLRLLGNLEFYLHSNLVFVKKSKYAEANLTREENSNNYPIGVLGNNVEVHFLHYKDESDALAKWQKRLTRVNMNNLFIAFTDRDLCTKNHLLEFDSLSFTQKVVFTAQSHPQIKSSVWIKDYSGQPCVGDLYANSFLYKRYFDVADWLNGGTGKMSFVIKLLTEALEVKPNQT